MAAREPDLYIGGGDDWMPVYFEDGDHPASGGCGNVSTCRTCRAPTVLIDFDRRYGSGNSGDVWKHTGPPAP